MEEFDIRKKEVINFYDEYVKNLNKYINRRCVEFEERHLEKLVELYLYAVGNGRRYRPILILSGSLVAGETRTDELLPLAAAIELIHKYSLLIDDYVDKDILRRGHMTFYKKYGSDNQQAMSTYFMNLIYREINTTRNIFTDTNLSKQVGELFQEILSDMSVGFIADLNHSDELKGREINDMLTTTLLRNSLLIGYLYGCDKGKYDELLYRYLYDMGNHVGSAFQTLNDLEMFVDEKKQIQNKGLAYSDIREGRNNRILELIPKEVKGYLTPDATVKYAIENGMTNKLINEVYDELRIIENTLSLLPERSMGTDYLKLFFIKAKKEAISICEEITQMDYTVDYDRMVQ